MKISKGELRKLIKEAINEMHAEVINESQDYGVRWNEFNRKNQLVTKQKFFRTEKDRDKFIKKLMRANNFNQILATSESTTTTDVSGFNSPMSIKKLRRFIDDEE